MEKYIKAELEVIKINSEDVITTSDGSFCPAHGSDDDLPVTPIG